LKNGIRNGSIDSENVCLLPLTTYTHTAQFPSGVSFLNTNDLAIFLLSVDEVYTDKQANTQQTQFLGILHLNCSPSEQVASPVRERLSATNCIVQGIVLTLQLSAVVIALNPRRKLPYDWFSSAEGVTFLMTISNHLAANTLVYTYTEYW